MNEIIGNKCLGTMKFGTSISIVESNEILDFYFSNEGSFIDTANNYAFWNGTGNESETIIGDWCKKRKIRHEIIIATKIGAKPKSTGDQNLLEGLSKKSIVNAVEGSLKRLKTDYIDIVYEHFDFEKYPFYDRLETLNRLIEEGKIKQIGISNISLKRLTNAIQIQKDFNHFYIYIQQKYSYFNPINIIDNSIQKHLTEELELVIKEKTKMRIVAYSVLLSGRFPKQDFLPIEYDSEHNRTKLKNLNVAAEGLGCTCMQLIYAWMLNKQPQITPIMAVSSVDQLKQNLLAYQIRLDNNILQQLSI